jgi:hypothetical protein
LEIAFDLAYLGFEGGIGLPVISGLEFDIEEYLREEFYGV